MGKIVNANIEYPMVEVKVLSPASTMSYTKIPAIDNPSGATLASLEMVFNNIDALIGNKIPIMSSNTTPFGVASCSSCLSNNYNAWKAFNGISASRSDCTNGWLAASSDESPWLAYEWDSPILFTKLIIETTNNSTTATRTAQVLGLNDNDEWENCLDNGNSITLDFTKNRYELYQIDLNGSEYKAIKIIGNEKWYLGTNLTACTISTLMVY